MNPFYVKLTDDKLECQILAIDVTPDGRILLADNTNKRIKIFNKDRKFQSSLTFNSQTGPSSVAVTNNEEAITSLWWSNNIFV